MGVRLTSVRSRNTSSARLWCLVERVRRWCWAAELEGGRPHARLPPDVRETAWVVIDRDWLLHGVRLFVCGFERNGGDGSC